MVITVERLCASRALGWLRRVSVCSACDCVREGHALGSQDPGGANLKRRRSLGELKGRLLLAGQAQAREMMLFIGTRFSNLYT